VKIRNLVGCAAVTVVAAAVSAVPALQASAAPARPAGQIAVTAKPSGTSPGQSVSSVVSPSWQTNGTVWALAAVHGVIYVGGQFTSVRPPGDALGTGETPRTYLAAFSTSTGALLSFDPTLDGRVNSLAVSPDGSTLYVGGAFTHADGAYHAYLAAFSTSTGALISTWKPTAGAPVLSVAPSPNGSTVYAGGDFTKLDSVARTDAGAVTAATGALLPWAPVLNGTLTSVAVAPDDSRVLVGGYFTTINGLKQMAIGSTDPSTGANAPWASNIVPDNPPACTSAVKDIVISGSTAYIADEGTGAGCFDGDWAANVSTGALVWQNDCLGATQALVVLNGLLYKGSHAHDCAYAPGGFPQVANPAGGWVDHRLLTQSLVDGAIGHWTPTTNGNNLGPRVFATDGSELFLGGDFSTVNNKPQQGFARFEPTPDTTTPGHPVAPSVSSTSAGVDSVSFSAVADSDDGTLSYAIYRDSGKTPIATIQATSWPWAEPILHYRDAGLTPGSSHTYTVTASDGTHTSAKSPVSASVKVASTSPALSYWQTVLGDHPSFLWPLNEKSGTTAADASPNGFNGSYESGTTQGAAGPITGDPDTATSFNGQTGLVTSAKQVTGPQTFSIEGWFRTYTNTGGKLIGFGSSQTGLSTSYDRMIYMMNDGQLVFGVYNGGRFTIETTKTYNDGKWHYVVATVDPKAGMALYVDNQLIGTSTNAGAQNYAGYWRVGGDNLKGGWNLDFWGSNSQGTTEPNGYYFNGTIGDVAVYPFALSAAQVAAHYAANALSH
jgi:hypothetical protein